MSKTNTIRRIVRSGLQGFVRNGFVTLASILVMTVTLFMIGASLFLGAVLDSTIVQLEEKVDINVYFVTSASEADILSLRSELQEFPEVRDVEYVSRQEVLEDFRTRHADEELTLQALEELGENPFGAILNVQAEDTSQYETIATFLESDEALSASGENIIESVNFFRNKEVIDKLTQITDSTQTFSFFVTLFLVILTVMITYNTIRLAIYTAREEISIMKLVGASNTYVRGPFVIEGILYGLVSAIITLIIFYPATFLIGDSTEKFFVNFNLFSYYINNFGEFFVIILVSGILLGAVSSYLAVKKHLKV
jgi:cell division transport system permease protein